MRHARLPFVDARFMPRCRHVFADVNRRCLRCFLPCHSCRFAKFHLPTPRCRRYAAMLIFAMLLMLRFFSCFLCLPPLPSIAAASFRRRYAFSPLFRR